MSTPDPRTEAAYKIVRDWYVNGGPHDLTKRKDLIDAITDALTTEAARVRESCASIAMLEPVETNDPLNHAHRIAHRICEGKDRAVSQWSTARPTVAGWYWWRSLKGNEPEAVHLIDPDIVMLAGDDRIFSPSQMVNGIPGEWCPIARPE